MNNTQAPHAPDVAERETLDDGFSRGWGAHFQPAEAYWVDCHTHMLEQDPKAIVGLIGAWGDRLDAWRLRRTVAMDGYPENAGAFAAAARVDDRFAWLARLEFDGPDTDGLERCLEAGAAGLKLHNKDLIESAVHPAMWLSEQWHRIYRRMGQAGLPVLWHVTQRLSDSPYTGGGRNSYWETGWAKGCTYGNADVLNVFLQVVQEHRGTNFIGAHQLHLGFDRLDELLAAHPNLYIDTSIGCFVRWGDQMYPEDRERARAFFVAWADRILFGTDCILASDLMGEFVYQAFLGHVRYIRQLRLPDDVLQKVAHGNAERLMQLSALRMSRRGALRP